jgi:hypothetical protein
MLNISQCGLFSEISAGEQLTSSAASVGYNKQNVVSLKFVLFNQSKDLQFRFRLCSVRVRIRWSGFSQAARRLT